MSARARKTHAEISLSIDGVQVVCQVPYRYLNQVAASDDIHTDKDYIRIAQDNIEAIEPVVRARMASHVLNKPMRLERSDFPPASHDERAAP